MGVILVLTHGRDDCATMVIQHLKNMGASHVRFNTEEFQKEVKFTVSMATSGLLDGCYHFPDRDLRFGNIGVVWNRRVHDPMVSDELSANPELKQWMLDESMNGLATSFTLIKAPVVNPWEENERLKFNKWLQMKRAAELGLEVPASCMTNNLDAIRDFWEEVGHEMIFKKIRKGVFRFGDGRTMVVHTNKIPPEVFNEEALQRMRFCPMFLQQHIKKKYDVRSVVVGGSVFSVAIHSQNIPDGVVDYRTAGVLGRLREMKHEAIDLGSEINSKLVAYTKSFGLTFGAIDLIITPDNRVVFLEDNPNGQWGWLEEITGIPIAGAFAEHLVSLNEGG